MRRLHYWFAMWRWAAKEPPMPMVLLEHAPPLAIEIIYSDWQFQHDAWAATKPTRKDFGL